MNDSLQCILKEIDDILTPEEKEKIERIVYEELENFGRCLRQAAQDLRKSESLGQLMFEIEKFSSIYSLVYGSILSKLSKRISLFDLMERLRLRLHIPYWRWQYIYNLLESYLLHKFKDAFERFHEMLINEAISVAKSIGDKFGLSNIGITTGISTGITGISFTIQFSFNVEIK